MKWIALIETLNTSQFNYYGLLQKFRSRALNKFLKFTINKELTSCGFHQQRGTLAQFIQPHGQMMSYIKELIAQKPGNSSIWGIYFRFYGF